MAKIASSIARTPLGIALDEHLAKSGMTLRAAASAARTTEQQVYRYRTETRKWAAGPLTRLAKVLGMDVNEALRLAGIVVVPDSFRVLRESEVQQLLAAS